jgi:type I restriction enzyme S subunit
VLASATGTTVKHTSPRRIGKFCFRLPPLDQQKAIAITLRVLDDKIDLNRKMNETLEAMARSLFKSWFVNFDPVRAKAEGRSTGLPDHIAALFPDAFEDSELGEIPSGWCVSSVGEIAEVIDCLHSKKPERQKEGKPLLQLWNIREDALLDLSDTYFVSEDDYQEWISRMEAVAGDCVITNVGRVGAVAQIPTGAKAALGRNMTGVRCRAQFPFPTYLIQALTSEAMGREIELRKDSGTILDALNVRNIPRLRVVLPSKELLGNFELLSRPLRARMENLQQVSSTLASMRDSLLPKLISGEIRIGGMEGSGDV